MIFATAPLSIVDLPTTHTYGVLVPRLIILHATVGKDSRKYLVKNDRGVSIHRLIDKRGTIYKMAEDDQVCGHVGFSRLGDDDGLNDQALGIEFENWNDGRDPFPRLQVDAGAAQVVEWWGKHGYLPILSHAQVDTQGKSDPKGFPWVLFYQRIWHYLAQAARAAG